MRLFQKNNDWLTELGATANDQNKHPGRLLNVCGVRGALNR